MLDLVLVGDSLSVGVLAWRLLQKRPEIAFAVLEHRSRWPDRAWRFRSNEVTKTQLEWLWILGSLSWPSFDVITRTSTRRIGGGFHFIRGAELHAKVSERLGDRLRTRAEVVSLDARSITLASGETIEAKAVIDGRVTEQPTSDVFHERLRLNAELSAPHAFEVPIGLDLRAAPGVVSTLTPLGATEVTIELRRFGATAAFDDRLEAVARAHLAACGLAVKDLRRVERAVGSAGAPPELTRPIVTPSLHPFESDEVRDAVQLAEAVCELPVIDAPGLTALFRERSARRWNELQPLRALATALPNDASRVLEAVSRLPDHELDAFLNGAPSGLGRARLFGMLSRATGLLEAARRWRRS